MIAIAARRLFLARASVDMRKSYDSLAELVQHQLERDPMSGDAFVFVGRDRRRLKALVWDGDGFWLCARRLARGTFALPEPALTRDARETIELDAGRWSLLLSGITVLSSRQSPRWRRSATT